MEEFVSIETEKLAREKGFNITQTLITNYLDKDLKIEEYTDSDGILQSTLQKWLRDIHNIDVEVNRTGEVKEPRLGYLWNIFSDTEFDYTEDSYEIYEKALEIGLQEALKLIK